MTVADSPTNGAALTDDPILRCRNVSVMYDMDRGVSQVVDSVDIDIDRQEILGIVGESGSGKSMFASSLLDAVPPPGRTTGSVTYHPKNSAPIELLNLSDSELNKRRWEDISMVFQGAMSSFNPTMKIREHFEETIKTHDRNYDERMSHAYQLLSDLYLEPSRVMDSYPHELSGGMKQRALIALSMVLEPAVLIMDEPTGALDLLMQRSITSLLADLQEEYDLTVVFITHDLPLVAGLCDRLAVMYSFEFVEIGQSDELLKDAAHPYTRALLRAVPSLDMPLNEMHVIEGESPDPVNVPQGCSYHPRCPLADDNCTQNDPQYHQVDGDHHAACFHWEQSADAIPYGFEEDPGSGDGGDPTTGETHHRVAYNRTESDDVVVSLDDIEVHFEETTFLQSLFGSEEAIVRAVDGVSFEIPENDVVALVGESGCGKTTLGKVAVGLQRPTGGSVEYRGQDIWDAKDKRGTIEIDYGDIRRALQIIHQDPGSSLNPQRTVLASLSEPLIKWRSEMTANDRERVIYNLLERVGITPPEDYAARYPHQLSGGEQQRIALGRALLMRPDVILADEAVSALDVSLRVEMMDLMLELQDLFDTSYLFISHDLSNARYLTEQVDGRIGIMYLGRLVEIGPAKEVLNDPKHPYTKVLKWATPVLDPDLAKDASTQEPPVRDIDIPDPADPPSGCRFHNRCPEAREICRRVDPDLIGPEDGSRAACFREDEDHDYWESDPIEATQVELPSE